ncbi:MAG: Hpt domain-containing protein [Nitrospirae bacterium]|nr:Hpt domain-containing protein [Nitrospirota bacterium]
MSESPVSGDGTIRVTVDPDLEDLVPGFLQNRHKDVEAIRLAVEREDWATLQRLGHSMKGSGGGYGFDSITTLGAGIETAAKARDTSAIERLVSELDSYLDHIEVVFG